MPLVCPQFLHFYNKRLTSLCLCHAHLKPASPKLKAYFVLTMGCGLNWVFYIWSFFTVFVVVLIVVILGWLIEPDSRPPFTQLVRKFEEFLDDPLRYVLTTSDGCMSDYGLLPSNILQSGEFTYENPFLGSGQFNSVENGNGQTSPYGNLFPSSEYQNSETQPEFDEVRIHIL